MRFLRQIAFYFGLAMGLVTVAAAGTVALTYLFTGKFPAAKMAEGKTEMTLLTSDEVVALVREQVDKARMAQQAEAAGGEEHD
ncbi:MAG: hypothetical protein ACK2UC_03485 [Anaerolineae bacterium]|jgi:hypothetical protein